MDLGLKDNVCVVTGSTAGIGLEIARLLQAEGATVVTTGRRDDGIGELHVAADLAQPGRARARRSPRRSSASAASTAS